MTNSEYVANLELSRVLTRHVSQLCCSQRVTTQDQGSMTFTLCLAAFVGILLSFAV